MLLVQSIKHEFYIDLAMAIDKDLYRKTFKIYRKWNEAELVDRIRKAEHLSPREAWEQYVDLWEFCMKLSPKPNPLQSKLKFSDWQKYYSRVQKLEEWKRQHGKRT